MTRLHPEYVLIAALVALAYALAALAVLLAQAQPDKLPTPSTTERND